MEKRELFSSAIADAKIVKDTALFNAKSALEETFTPYLKSMFSAKIDEIENDYNEDAEELNEMDGEDEELNIDEIMNEIDEAKSEEEPEEEKESEKDEEKPEEESEEELNIEEMSEEDLKEFIEDVVNEMIESGELEPGESEEEPEEDQEIPDEDKEEPEEDIDIDIEDEETEENDDDLFEELDFIGENEIDEEGEDENLEELNRELQEAYNTIEQLKSQLNEQKIVNSKLLYTNKIFTSKTLTESKKIQILKAFDKATSVKEAKIIYETLKDNLNDKTIIKEFKGMASKSITPIKENQQPIIEVDNQYSRWRIIAGLDK